MTSKTRYGMYAVAGALLGGAAVYFMYPQIQKFLQDIGLLPPPAAPATARVIQRAAPSPMGFPRAGGAEYLYPNANKAMGPSVYGTQFGAPGNSQAFTNGSTIFVD